MLNYYGVGIVLKPGVKRPRSEEPITVTVANHHSDDESGVNQSLGISKSLATEGHQHSRVSARIFAQVTIYTVYDMRISVY